MVAGVDLDKTFSVAVILIACSVLSFLGCSDPQADRRARLCKGAGLAPSVVKECRRSQDDYNRIMEPIRAKQELEEVTAFNAALEGLPLLTMPKDKYKTISLQELNTQHDCCFLRFTNVKEAPQHPLFGKRFRVQGKLTYYPTDYEEETEEHFALEMPDPEGRKKIWHLDSDIDSLSRSERALIRAQCKFLDVFDGCSGEFFGVIGTVNRGDLKVLGLQIEYMELNERRTKKERRE